mmetsp:Transcript_86805/g.173292  ORF Transcript_86805/g.173292 Transcript_86805/m.173292 type:complete len:205 (-) Transcript_86805:67-681(-)|eukprot:CAMPEP_0174703396 /NCGR_PEP_ID=MMETSP1094-20130205/7360_1 /TAXON_ID=156173 /ORGANISM="Chrysochromulina brevifilum, Strain UTEX LB 985" /LENGTH=204 /DNA_ID=CAMNT_0015901317 /DNA_START=134 /DNA_END=748 /DNA_ORIENTATION=-
MAQSLTPPENFAMVWRGIYRSSYPTKRNFTFLQHLRLRSILFLCPEEYPESHTSFMQEHGVQLLQYASEGNKDLDEIPEETIRRALRALLDPRNHPLLVHCNQGKHRTGCLVGCLRRVQRWSLVAIFDEYRRFAGSKARVVDQQFIERINLSGLQGLDERTVPHDDQDASGNKKGLPADEPKSVHSAPCKQRGSEREGDVQGTT